MPMRQILVVDDDRGIRDTLATLLEHEGYGVRRAENGQVALDIIRGDEPKPDLMLLDLMMPVLSGFELLEMMEDGDPDLDQVPIFVVSAFNAPMSATRGGGVRRCFGKPFDADALLGAIRDRFQAPEARV
jgi:CheY-like chemotaxis protein